MVILDNSEDLRPLFKSIEGHVALLSADGLTFEKMTAAMTDRKVLKDFSQVLESMNVRNKAGARTLLSAFMICKHPEVLSCDEGIRKEAEKILQSLAEFISLGRNSFVKDFEFYQSFFLEWQKKDKRQLENNINTEILSADSFLASLGKQDSVVQDEWTPHLTEHRFRLESMFKNLTMMDSRSKINVSNVQIAHDLFLEGPESFDYFKLYMPNHVEALERNISRLNEEYTNLDVVLETLKAVKVSLIGMLPEGKATAGMIEEGLDLEMARTQLGNGSFEPEVMLKFIVSVMSELCAPIRDPQITSIQSLLNSNNHSDALASILRVLSAMTSDCITYSLSRALPHLPTLILQYERDAFIGEFKEDLVMLRGLVKRRVYRRMGMGEREMGVEVFVACLEKGAEVEVHWLDTRRIASWRDTIQTISKEATRKLTKAQEVLPDDPTYKLLHKRLLSTISQHLLHEPVSPSTPLSPELKNLLSDMLKWFEHHCKVFQPVYYQLLSS